MPSINDPNSAETEGGIFAGVPGLSNIGFIAIVADDDDDDDDTAVTEETGMELAVSEEVDEEEAEL